jgi:Flp pilus assembly protein TadB
MATSERPISAEQVQEPSPDQPLSELVSRTTSDLGMLVRKEIELAKIEIKDDLRHTAKAGEMFGAAGFSGYLAALLVSLALVFALDLVLPLWSAFLIVGAAFAILAYVLFQRGRTKMKQFTPGPEQTIETVKEDIEWAKARKK